MHADELRQHLNDPSGADASANVDGQAFTRVAVHHRQHAQLAAIEQCVGNEVHAGAVGEAVSVIPAREDAQVAQERIIFRKASDAHHLLADDLRRDPEARAALEAYAERKTMPEKNREIMAAVIRAAGRGNDRASQFAEKHENYLLEPRYLDMFRAGREAMTIFMKDEDLRAKAASGELSKEDEAALGHDAEGDIGMFLENALDHWNSKADDKKQQGGTVAVMFTAILGAFSEATGDEATQRMVHAHNRIVRENLRYAKRQLTWFRHEAGVVWVDATSPAGLPERAPGYGANRRLSLHSSLLSPLASLADRLIP